MIKSCISFIHFLNFKQKKNFLNLQILILFNAFLELFSVSLIIPFIGLISNLDNFLKNDFVKFFYSFFGFTDNIEFILFVGVIIIIFLILSAASSILTTWQLNLFCNQTGYEVGLKLFSYYLNESINFHSRRQTSNLINNITTETNRLTNSVLYNILIFNSKIFIIFPIILFLLFYNIKISVISLFFFSLIYLFLFQIFKKKLYSYGNIFSKQNNLRINLINETLNGIREIKIYKQINNYLKRFAISSLVLSKTQAATNAIVMVPRYLLELSTFGFLVFLILYLSVYKQSFFLDFLPLISIFALAGLKLIPALHQLYTCVSHLKSHIAAYENLKHDLFYSKKLIKKQENYIKKIDINHKTIKGKNIFSLEKVGFAYFSKNNTKNYALRDINLIIPRNAIIGLVGESGSGKSTLLDLICGFIQPQRGKIFIDDIDLSPEKIIDWQNRISYVSQKNFFLNESILKNIIIVGDTLRRHNFNRVLEITELKGLIKSIKFRYNNKIGEFGSRLSGGQKQRIAIARALYKVSDLVIFDEATNALDANSESNIIKNISTLKKEKSFLIASHRVSSLKNCDLIYLLKNGQINDSGTYSELLKKNIYFRSLLDLNADNS
jgi:HlyD family secretion protein